MGGDGVAGGFGVLHGAETELKEMAIGGADVAWSWDVRSVAHKDRSSTFSPLRLRNK